MMIDMAREFSPYPSGRVPDDGEFNGQKFRREYLMPAIVKILNGDIEDTEIVIDIDGVRVFGSSFLEEAFGGLVREDEIDSLRAIPLLRIKRTKAGLQMYEDDIKDHLTTALEAAKAKPH
ncbi:STAS-like domain-containing protein [Sulfitobacter sp. M22]|jgi:hypothetical protein|uniref:STAS-like domain-containing protein n=1 Tax=Sulfitobacter sp. M22 TaxID=2675332 RepID=UPI001F18C405|nr:STAS-like domain-containing protein [Sulfitobacter sp. M22]MCF7725303.1 DUF4325 domain-containing protein [Sulfitobacter sp. M22]|tara:strand:- start:692 stop:1051 length:360 start_codon:yes stop_codon:yes gene_type:complete